MFPVNNFLQIWLTSFLKIKSSPTVDTGPPSSTTSSALGFYIMLCHLSTFCCRWGDPEHTRGTISHPAWEHLRIPRRSRRTWPSRGTSSPSITTTTLWISSWMMPFHLSVPVLWTQNLGNALKELIQIWLNRPLNWLDLGGQRSRWQWPWVSPIHPMQSCDITGISSNVG